MKDYRVGKKEIIMLIFIALILLLIFLVINVFLKNPGNKVDINVDGKYYGTYSLETDDVIEISTDRGLNKLEIREGGCRMYEANCPDGLCKKQGRINAVNETITCLPNRVFVRVLGDESEVDTFVK